MEVALIQESERSLLAEIESYIENVSQPTTIVFASMGLGGDVIPQAIIANELQRIINDLGQENISLKVVTSKDNTKYFMGKTIKNENVYSCEGSFTDMLAKYSDFITANNTQLPVFFVRDILNPS